MNMVGTPYSVGAFFPLDGLQRRQRIEALAGIDHGRAEVTEARLPITMPKQ